MLAARHFDNHVSLNQVLQLFYQLYHIYMLYYTLCKDLAGHYCKINTDSCCQIINFYSAICYPIHYTTP